MLWMIIGVFLILWLIGLITQLEGPIIPLLLISAFILLAVQFLLYERRV